MEILIKRFMVHIKYLFYFSFLLTITGFSKFGNAYAKSNDTLDNSEGENTAVVIDADYTLEEALEGITIPAYIKKDLRLVTVQYYGFDGRLHQGQLVVNVVIENDVKDIFKLIKEIKFPVREVIPISEYNWSDEMSMRDNNTSAFNFRYVSGTKILSMHAQGLAIDINPLQNPYVKNGSCSPKGSSYNISKRGTFRPDSEIVKAFKDKGWEWGGDWKSLKDYQHFQKDIH